MRKLSDFDYMLDTYDSQDQILEDLRKEFVNSFPIDYIRNQMTISEYIEGKGNKDSFCNRLERELAGLGSIKGATASKFGIYYSQKNQKYMINKVWQTPEGHPDLLSSFKKLRESIADLIEAGGKNAKVAIQAHPLATMVKMKILSVYYPEKYLNIFSERMLNYFGYQFYGDAFPLNASRFEKQQKLLKLKDSDEATEKWNNIKFGNYLYHLFPYAYELGKENLDNGCKNYSKIHFIQIKPQPPHKKEPKFPVAYDRQAIEFLQKKTVRKVQGLSKIDHIAKQKTATAMGYLGEKEVIAYEQARLVKYPDLQRKIKWQSQVSDVIGYDILSFEKDGTPRQIEVKSTTAKISEKFDFVLTENERLHALTLPNYWIYRVFDVKNKPVIYKIKNPLKNELAHLKPIKYQATIKVRDIR